MNFAHIVGEHHPESQWQGLLHTITSWLPLIIAIAIGLIVVYFVAKSYRKPQKEEVKKDHDHRL